MNLGRLPGTNARFREAMLRAGVCGALFLLAGCARIDQATLAITSSHVHTYVVVDGTVLEGTVTLYPDRAGLLQADSMDDSGARMSCSGQLRYTSSKAGSLRLSCNNGTVAELSYLALDYTRGYGRIRDPDRVVSFTFGMDVDEAQGWLWAPAGQRVMARGVHLRVEPERPPSSH